MHICMSRIDFIEEDNRICNLDISKQILSLDN